MKNKILYALLSLVIAFGLWVYVITVVSPESEATYYDIPVVLNNESVLNDKGLMIVSEGNPKVTLRLKGNRSDLNKLKNSDITLVADLAKINDPGVQSLSYSISFPGDFASNAFETLSYSPDRITLNVVEWSTKELDITVNCVGSVHADYIIARENGITQDRNKITITGPKTVIDQIVLARVDVAVEGKSQTITESKRVTLCDAEGNPVDASQVLADVTEVNVSVRIQRVKTLQLVLNVTYGGGATKENTKIEMSATSIKVAGSERLLENLGATVDIGNLDVSVLKDDVAEFVYPINIPEGIDNLSGVTEVTATVTFPTLKTKTMTLPVSGNLMYNIPEGLEVVEIGTQQCTVTFRGPEDLMNLLSQTDVVIRVDLSDAEIGENLYEAQIQVVKGSFGSVGVVGTYQVLVRLEAEQTQSTPTP